MLNSLLRIEAVNLRYCIEDTEDLSTRRGGSLMLLEAINDIAEHFKDELGNISTGASAGLFRIKNGKNGDIAKRVTKHLHDNATYRHGTFVVDVVPLSDEKHFHTAEIAAVAANRWQQMQSLSFSTFGLSAVKNVECKVDEVRPAATTTEKFKGKENTPMSASVSARREHGKDSRREFYERILTTNGVNPFENLKYTDDFENLATQSVIELQPQTLDGKMAVFYADGNSFGKIARGCGTSKELEAWDTYIKAQRKALLAKMLQCAASANYWQTRKEELCLETLLWGGDELMFVVPGWCGMELADLFFEQTKGMQYSDFNNEKCTHASGSDNQTKIDKHKPVNLTHACGLVFCHHQAPISRIAHLAKALADKGKANREHDSLNWMVLESFDHAGGDLDRYLGKRFKIPPAWTDLALNPNSLAELRTVLPKLKCELPRSQMVSILRAMAENQSFDDERNPTAQTKRAYQQVAETGGDVFANLWKRIHPETSDWDIEAASMADLGAWIKLVELWDYCPDWNSAGTRQEQHHES